MTIGRRSLWIVAGALLLAVLTAFAVLVWPFADDDDDDLEDRPVATDVAPRIPAVAGAPGIGDPYYPLAGNGGYDVTGYELDLAYDPGPARLTGTATVSLRATQPLLSFNLDLRLPATAVQVDGTPAQFTQAGQELTITPDHELRATHRVVVEYGGEPATIPIDAEEDSPWKLTPDGAVVIGQPDIAPWWFPANDHPRDKATVTVSMTVPTGTEAISNGALVAGPEPTGDGRDRWRWSGGGEMAPYLAFMAIGQFDIERRQTADGPYLAAYSERLAPEVDRAARESVERTPEIASYLSSIFGPYPFDHLGGVVVDDLDTSFALENQTRPVYVPDFFRDGPDVDVVAHELAHQWFGDSVSVQNWRDIWLNEGFAVYAEWLYDEHTGGPTTAENAQLVYAASDLEPDFWSVPLDDPGPEDLFAAGVYYRGAMALQVIRSTIGDENFFGLLRAWVAEKRGGNGTVAEFLAMAEQRSGVDLDAVVQTWLRAPVRPPGPPA